MSKSDETTSCPTIIVRISPFLAVGIIVIVVVVLLGVGHLWQTVPSGWRVYRDPGGLYMMQIPIDWQSMEAGEGESGGDGSIVFHDTTWLFTKPGATGQSPTFLVDVTPLSDEEYRQAACQSYQLNPSSVGRSTGPLLGDIQSYYLGNSQLLLFAQNASFSLHFYYPGLPVEETLPLASTPVPFGVMQADQQIIDQIVQSFRAIPDQALLC